MSTPPPRLRRARSGVRTLRRIVGSVLLVLAAAVGWKLWRIQRPGPVVVEQTQAQGEMPARPTDETGCFDNFNMDWPGGAFRRLEAARACRNADGSSALTDVRIFVKRGARSEVTVRADRGLLPPDEAKDEPIRLSGKVHAQSEDGFSLDGEELLLAEAAQVVSSSQRVTFAMGDLNGEAGEMEHHWDTGETFLAQAPVLHVRGKQTSGREITVAGQRVRFDGNVPEGSPPETPRRIEVRGDGRIDHDGGYILGDRIDVEVAADVDEVRRIEATGGAETVSTAGGATADTGAGAAALVRRLRAGRVVHVFAPKNVLSRIQGEGAAVLTGARPGAAGAGPAELLTGDLVELDVTGDPPQVTAVHATGAPAHLALVAGVEHREAQAGDLRLRFSGQGSLERLEATGDAELTQAEPGVGRRLTGDRVELGFREGPDGLQPTELVFSGSPASMAERDATGGERTLVARQGQLQVGPDGQVSSGTLDGDVELRRPDATAIADRARIEGELTTLTGHASVENGGRTSHGDEIVHDRSTKVLRVKGRQHTIVREPDQGAGAGPLAGGDQPVYVSSDELIIDETTRRARYEGGRPAMRQGDDELRADVLVLDDEQGTLEATGNVESRLRMAEPGSGGPGDAPPDGSAVEVTEAAEEASAGGAADTAAAPSGGPGVGPAGPRGGRGGQPEGSRLFDPTRLVIGTSDVLRYDRATRHLHYEGHVSLTQEETELSADDVNALLGEAGGVSEMVARGAALFRSAQGEAEGEVIEYWADTDLVRVTQGRRPARARDVDGSFATGEVLEMTLGTRGIRVLSSAASRTRGSSALQSEAPHEQ